MKKFLLSVAVLATTLCASAQTFDFTGLQGVTPTENGSQGYVAATGTTIYDAITSGAGGSAYGSPLTYASLPGVGIFVKNSAVNAPQLRLYPSDNFQAGLFGNGSDCLLVFSNVANGKYIHVTFAQKGGNAVSTATFSSKLPSTALSPMGNAPGIYTVSTTAAPTATADAAAPNYGFVTGTLQVTTAGDIMLYITNTIVSKVVINDNATGGAGINDAISSDLLKKANNELVNPTNLSVEIYTVAGVKVMSSTKSNINLSGLAAGMYIAKTAQGNIH